MGCLVGYNFVKEHFFRRSTSNRLFFCNFHFILCSIITVKYYYIFCFFVSLESEEERKRFIFLLPIHLMYSKLVTI